MWEDADTIEYFKDGIRRYIIAVIIWQRDLDLPTGYKTKSSRVALDFLKKFQEVCPFKIRVVKTDNGSEFLGEFDRYLKEEGIRHYFNYPRFPKGNGYVERFNRTLEESFNMVLGRRVI